MSRDVIRDIALCFAVAMLACGALPSFAAGQGLLDDIQAEVSGEEDAAKSNPESGTSVDGNTVRITSCYVEYIKSPGIYAAESGRLIKAPEEGDFVTAEDLIAETDSTMAVFQQRIKYFDYQAEAEKLKSDVEIRFAKAQAEVDKAAFEDLSDANEKVKNAVRPAQLREASFKVDASKLRIEKTLNDMRISRAVAMVKHEEFKASEAMVGMHKIKSPVTGIVERPDNGPMRHIGEWVRPGELIAKVTQTDKLRVVGLLDQEKCNRKALIGKPVRITIPTRVENKTVIESRTVDSKIIHIGTQIDASTGDLEIWAEIDNPDGAMTPGQFYLEMQFEL